MDDTLRPQNVEDKLAYLLGQNFALLGVVTMMLKHLPASVEHFDRLAKAARWDPNEHLEALSDAGSPVWLVRGYRDLLDGVVEELESNGYRDLGTDAEEVST
jgi:hypothetical protein